MKRITHMRVLFYTRFINSPDHPLLFKRQKIFYYIQMNTIQQEVTFNNTVYTYKRYDNPSDTQNLFEEPSLEYFKTFCWMKRLDPDTLKAHYFYMCEYGLKNDIKKFLDHELLTQDILNEGLSYADCAGQTNTVDFLLERGAKNNRFYRMMLQSAMENNNIRFLNDIISSFGPNELIVLYDRLFHILGDFKLLRQMKDAGFDFGFNKGCLINRFARPTAPNQFANLIRFGVDTSLLLPESLDRIKEERHMMSLIRPPSLRDEQYE